MGNHYSLRPETIERISMQQTSTGDIAPEIQLVGIGKVYLNHSNNVDHYAKQGNERMARLEAAMRDRIYFEQVKPLIEQLRHV